jgi:tetratricopeptide (TPR) repeat protein
VDRATGRKGGHDEAIADYAEAIRHDPKTAETSYLRALAYEERGDTSYLRALAYEERGDTSKAAEDEDMAELRKFKATEARRSENGDESNGRRPGVTK